ncbi:RagB/SusD family nutrient uptake outer membrane protein [Hymenobacter sp. BT635]|uniref:RagB/SusD family nutrient uptake outer membrane protein n=1 Tax=Hymenobacter nitidus TaxID=2880929 RepID=A0ABS8AG06_9BACT|nr:RagB/SusD family nutrient uptake outer membrane protein [Hymenobacter nitidus]MCB2378155.1 RagB/SusD family nutrient uptake outer membrane protein [Hymenobacter nitidus]
MSNTLFSKFLPYNVRVASLVAVLAFGAASCNEITDLEPKTAVAEEVVYSSPEKVNLAVTGVYNAAQSGFYDPLNGTGLAVRGYPFGAAANEFGDVRGEDVVDMAGFFGIVYANTQQPNSPNIHNMWATLYAMINQANTTIAGVRTAQTSGVIPAADAVIFEGELRFLRALAYHELLVHFAKPYTAGNGANPGVPYRDFAINTIEAATRAKTQGRNTVKEVYDKMLEDLVYAETNLPATRSGTLKVTRVTKGAAIALKQRLNLHMGNWDAAVTEGNKIVSATFTSPIGGYALTPSADAAFVGNAVTNEAIFSVENSADDNPGVNGALPNMYGSPAATPPAGIGGRGLIAISPVLYNAPFWTCTDRRRTQLLQFDGTRYFTYKYKDAKNNTDWAPIIRYSEVILNQAEAEARKGNTARALALLNAVRNRSVAAADVYATAPADLVQAILNERRIELVAEGFRWDDIHRLSADAQYATRTTPTGTVAGLPSKITSAGSIAANYACNGTGVTLNRSVTGIPATDGRFLWPIPAVEIANNPTLARQQNPGYN